MAAPLQDFASRLSQLSDAMRTVASGGSAPAAPPTDDEAIRDAYARLAELELAVREGEGCGKRLAVAEAEAALLRNTLATTEEIAGIGNWTWDVKTNKVTWSEGLCKIYGINPQDFGASYEAFLGFVHPDDVEYVKSRIGEAYKTGRSFEFDHRIIKPDGHELTLHARGQVLMDDTANVSRMFGTGQDVTANRKMITDLRQYTGELEHMNKLMIGRELKMIEIKKELEAAKAAAARV